MQMRSLIPTDRNLGAGLTDCLRITDQTIPLQFATFQLQSAAFHCSSLPFHCSSLPFHCSSLLMTLILPSG